MDLVFFLVYALLLFLLFFYIASFFLVSLFSRRHFSLHRNGLAIDEKLQTSLAGPVSEREDVRTKSRVDKRVSGRRKHLRGPYKRSVKVNTLG